MSYADAIQALADPTRREIFERLRQGAEPVGKLAEGLEVSRPAVSQHLKVLEQAGLVRVRREGARRIYSLEIRGLRELRRYLDGLWDEALDAFQREVEEHPALSPPRATSPPPRAAGSPGKGKRKAKS